MWGWERGGGGDVAELEMVEWWTDDLLPTRWDIHSAAVVQLVGWIAVPAARFFPRRKKDAPHA
jgi:hypothetical protein